MLLDVIGGFTGASSSTANFTPMTDSLVLPTAPADAGFELTGRVWFVQGSATGSPRLSVHFQNDTGDDVGGFDVAYPSAHATQFSFDLIGGGATILRTLARDTWITWRYVVNANTDPSTGGTAVLECPLGTPIGSATLTAPMNTVTHLTLQSVKFGGTLTAGRLATLHYSRPPV